LEFKNLNHHFAQGVFIFSHKAGFAAGAERRINNRLGFLARLPTSGKINPENGALLWLAFDL
jgi:hypothetical protein